MRARSTVHNSEAHIPSSIEFIKLLVWNLYRSVKLHSTEAVYQGCRPPPRVPRSLPPPKLLPPPPPPGGAIRRASFTVTGLQNLPSNFVIASAASCSVDISTNPKPLFRPVSRSVMTRSDSTRTACGLPTSNRHVCAENGVIKRDDAESKILGTTCKRSVALRSCCYCNS